MKTMTAEELKRMALRTGAEVVIDGRPFNAERAQVQLRVKEPLKPASEPPAPALPAAEPTFTRSEVARMLAEQEERLTSQIHTAIIALREATAGRQGALPGGFQMKYGKDGELTFVGVEWKAA